MELTWEHEGVARLAVAGGPADLHGIRQWAARHVADLPRTCQADVVVLCNELVSHTEKHRGGVREVRLRRLDPGCVRVEVDDRAASPIVRPALQDWTPEGVHLLVIERLSAQWGAVPGQDGTTMWADVLVVLPRQVANPRNR